MSDAEPPQPPPPAAETEDDLGALQEWANKLAGESRKKGRSSGQKDYLEKLGFEDLDSAVQYVQQGREREEAEKDEIQLAREKAEAAEREAATAKAELARSNLRVAVSEALLDADVPPTRLSAAMRHIDLDSISDEHTIEDEIEIVKRDLPELFAKPDEGAPAPRSWASAGGTGEKKKPSAGKTGLDAGRARYKEMSEKAPH